MKSVRRPFESIKESNPYWSSYTCFTKVLEDRTFSKGTISKWFYKLVDKDDCLPKERRSVVAYLKRTYCRKVA